MESSYNPTHIYDTQASVIKCLDEMHFLYWPLNEQRAAFKYAGALKDLIVSVKCPSIAFLAHCTRKSECAPLIISNEFFL